MKKILWALLVFTSFSALAGDMYLVCEDEKNDDFLSASITDGKARMMLTLEDQPLLLDLKTIKSEERTYYDLKVNFLRSHRAESILLKAFEEMQLGSYHCLVRD